LSFVGNNDDPTIYDLMKLFQLQNRYLILLVLATWFIFCHNSNFLFAQRPTKIDLISADRMQFDRAMGDDVRRLIDNVQFRHEDTNMFCDSAYLYSESNSLRAFGNVFIQVSDTVSIYSDKLYYNGNSRLAELIGNVRMVDPQMTLTTNQLFYDLNTDVARYITGGKLEDLDNVLVSREGYYYAEPKEAYFRHEVVLTNPEYIMYSDTLKYNTLTEIAYFYGPTTIESEENTIFCRNGWYDTRNDIARFSRDAFFTNKEQSLTGDTLFYDRNLGYGRADNNIVMRDSVQNTIITGHFAEHFEEKGLSIVTNEALLILVAETDSLFLHADTLKSLVDQENDHRWVFAYYKAKFFRNDIQGLSDSLVYSFSDSTIYMYHNPVLWSDVHQLTAQRIEVRTGEEEIKTVHLFEAAFIVSEEEDLGFNQVKGRDMIGHFSENELYRIDVDGNGETIYFIREEDGSTVGINKALASDIIIYVEDRKVSGIRFISRPEAQLFPPDEIPEDEKLLRNFQWLDSRRPVSREDVFLWR
jgi:lipopolysaccharide export system protein LptA